MTKLPKGTKDAVGLQDKQPQRVLLIGYGNLSRRDDGVALHILRRLRSRLGLAPGELDTDGGIEPGTNVAMMCVHQLTPELAETANNYDILVYIDAHVAETNWEPVRWTEIKAAFQYGMIGHHLKPGTILALCQSLYGKKPSGYMLSVLGHDFDFGQELSPETSALADQAVGRLESSLREWEAIPV